jgi:hypothetical protein
MAANDTCRMSLMPDPKANVNDPVDGAPAAPPTPEPASDGAEVPAAATARPEPAPGPVEGASPPPARRRRRWPWIVAAALGIVAIVALIAGTIYVQPQPLLPEARAALASTDAVAFADEPGWLSFTPIDATTGTGLVFFPGGKVEPAAYAPAAQAIAEAGYPVYIVKMPLNLAVLGTDRAGDVIAAHPEIARWAIAGHSLGGAMATTYIASHPDAMRGLALWAAYPTSDISALPLAATSIWGSLDSGAARFGDAESRRDLPPDTVYVEIPGGNHEQMGWYTGQPNDPPATIERADQQAAVVAATLDMLGAVDEAP